MRGTLLALCVVAFTWLAPSRAIAAPAKPAAVLAKITLGAPSGLDGLKAFADNVQPGISMVLSADMLLKSALGLPVDGLDLTGPVHVLAVTNKTSKGFLVMAKVSDKTLLAPANQQKGGWAVVGSDATLVKLAAPWALATLTGSVPADLVGTFYPDAALKTYEMEIGMVKSLAAAQSTGMQAQMVTAWMDGLEGLAKDTIAVTVRFDASKDRIGLDFAFAPKAKSKLSKFVAAQKPMDLALLGKLAPGAAPMLMGGRLALGPYKDGVMQMMSAVYGAMSTPNMVPAFEEIMKVTTGEFAGSANVDKKAGMQLRALYGITDATKADAAVGKLMGLMTTPQTMTVGTSTTTTVAVAGSTTYDNVTIRAYDTTTSPAQFGNGKTRAQTGAFDKVLAVTSDGAINNQIDVARGKKTAYAMTASQKAAFDVAIARKDSFAATIDIGTFAALGGAPQKIPAGSDLLFSMGFADRSAHFYMAMPASTIKAMKP